MCVQHLAKQLYGKVMHRTCSEARTHILNVETLNAKLQNQNKNKCANNDWPSELKKFKFGNYFVIMTDIM